MSCESFDWKAYVLGEQEGAEGRRHEEHLRVCQACAEDVAGLKVTVTALRRLPKMEPPRRIAFVSDPVAEPGWWARFWVAGPRLAFGSAAMLSLAILAHGMMARTAPATDAINAEVEQEVARRLPAALDQAVAQDVSRKVSAQFAPQMMELKARLDGLESGNLQKVRVELDERRKSDLQEIRAAFELMERRMNTRYLSAAKFGGE
jgi:anti-sigma factor RsiW